MSLKGKAKTEYMREYMRRRRAGKLITKPRAKTTKIDPAERQKLEARIRELEARIRDLEAELARKPRATTAEIKAERSKRAKEAYARRRAREAEAAGDT